MNYVEWLRVRNHLRVTAIAFGALVLLALVLRITAPRWDTVSGRVHLLELDPGTTVTHSVLPNGTHRTIVDDPKKKTTIVIDDLGYFGKRVVITGPRSTSHTMHNHILTFGSFNVHESRDAKHTITVIRTDEPVPIVFYAAFGVLVGLIVATLLGAPLARENDGHLEVALLRPVSRTRFALGAIGADLAGIVLAMLMAVVAMAIVQSFMEMPRFTADASDLLTITMAFIGPFAWYAMLLAATSSLSRGYGAILGLSWPVAIFVMAFGDINWGASPLGQIIHAIFWPLSRIDPLTYMGIDTSNSGTSTATSVQMHTSSGGMISGAHLSVLALLFVIYLIAAVLQWRRVEA
jgi:hypothetical protein